MIPVALLLGLAFGRWLAVPVAAVGWAAILYVDGACRLDCAPAAAALAAANAVVGVLAHKALVWPARRAIAAWRAHARRDASSD
jgi:hypothetical protein